MVKIYATEHGVVLEFWANIDLSAYPKVELIIRKPSGETIKVPMYISERSDYVAMRLIQPGELDEKGVYKFQLVAEDDTGTILYYSRIVTVYVEQPIPVGVMLDGQS